MQAISRAAVAACSVILAGCAFSPPSFRVVAPVTKAQATNPLKDFEILPPGVQRVEADGKHRYVMDLPLDTPAWRCPTIEVRDGATGFSARAVRAGFDTAILRVSIPTRPSSTALRTAWDDWKKVAGSDAITSCLSRTDTESLPGRLEAARPVDGEESLEAAFGRAGVVLLKPGMSVCASDAYMRTPTASVQVLSGSLCARVARSPVGGSVLDPMRYTLGNVTSGDIDRPKSHVTKFASWAEIPRESNPLQYVVRYPSNLTKPSENIPAVSVSLLVSLGAGIDPAHRLSAMQCIAKKDTLKYFCPESATEPPEDDCKTLHKALNPKPQCYRFGERGVMNVTIPVVVNGAQSDVEVGSLVGDAATRLGRAATTPPATMMRWHDGRLYPVEFELKDRAFDLPMLSGDQLSW